MWVPQLMVMNSPVVSGTVVTHEEIKQWGLPREDFTLRLDDGTRVHARVEKYLRNRIPHEVRFRYSGNPEREVFLFEHEQNLLWIALLCWGLSALMIYRFTRRPR